jgi:glycosyltransferase involved in cell wall biosynthesis
MKGVMRILYLVPYAPTPIRTRPYNLIRALARRGHRITVATLWEDAAERGALVELRAQGIEVLAAPLTPVQKVWNLLHALPTRTPLQAAYCWQPALAEAVVSRQLSEGSDRPFDVVHVEHLRGAPYGLYLKSPMLNTQYPIPVVWDSVDCISYLFEQAARDSRSLQGRLMTRLELTRTRRYEGWLVGQFDRVLVTSPVDQEALTQLHQTMRSQEDKGTGRQGDGLPLSLSPSLPLTVLPNGVDLSYFAPDDTPRDPATVLFSGKMSYHANVTAALHLVHDIMPLVWEERPEAKVIIAGKDPPSEIRNLDSAI